MTCVSESKAKRVRPTERIHLSSILVEPVEGDLHGHKWLVTSWKEADLRLDEIAKKASKDCYHKVDCTVTFGDGKIIKWTYDVFYPSNGGDNRLTLQAELLDSFQFWAGKREGRPKFYSDADWKKYLRRLSKDEGLASRAEFAKGFLARYEIGQS